MDGGGEPADADGKGRGEPCCCTSRRIRMFRDFVCPSPVQVAWASSGATRAGQTRAHGHEAQGQDQSIGTSLEQGRINADDPQTPKLKYHGVYHEDNALLLTLTFFALFSCRPSPAPSSPIPPVPAHTTHRPTSLGQPVNCNPDRLLPQCSRSRQHEVAAQRSHVHMAGPKLHQPGDAGPGPDHRRDRRPVY